MGQIIKGNVESAETDLTRADRCMSDSGEICLDGDVTYH